MSRSSPASSRRGPRGRPCSKPRRIAYALSTRPNTRRGGTESSAGAAWGCVGCCSEPAALPLPRYEPASWRASRTVPQRWPNLVNGPLRGVPSPRKLWGDCCHAVLAEELGVHSLMPESKAEIPAFCSLLAKIALSYIAAEGRASAQKSRLAEIAVGENMNNCLHYIGSVATDEPPSESLHELSLARHTNTGSVLVRLRLLAKLGTPTYFVVLPESIVAKDTA